MTETAPPIAPDALPARAVWFAEACRLVGGQHEMARLLNMNHRSVRYLVSGKRPITDAVAKEASELVLQHGQECEAMAFNYPPI